MKLNSTSLRRGVQGLRDFSGRDSRAEFWPYAGTVLGIMFVLSSAASFALVILSILRSPPSPEVAMWLALLGSAGTVAVVVVLLAAAVTRRLHDRGHRGWWGLPPLVALGSAMVLMVPITRLVREDGDPTLFFVGFGVTVLYFCFLAVLVLQLALPGDPQKNRFGPG